MGREVNVYYSGTNKIVLFLNDELHSSGNFQYILDKYGFSFVCSTTCRNAVNIAESLSPALILVDLNLKEHIKSASIKKAKIIFISTIEADFFESQIKNILSYFLVQHSV